MPELLREIILIFAYMTLIIGIGLTVQNLYLILKQMKEIRRQKDIDKNENQETKLITIVQKKKEQFLNLPNIRFHYIDKEQVNLFYNDYFTEPIIENMVSEDSEVIDANFAVKFPRILKSNTGTKSTNKRLSTIKLPEVSLNHKFLRYQNETIKNDQVALGIEEAEIEFSELKQFEIDLKNIKNNYDISIGEEIINSNRKRLKEKAAREIINRLTNIRGWVLLEGKFLLVDQNNFYKCVYHHPVNEYLDTKDQPISITVIINKESIESYISGNYTQSIGQLIPLRIYGHVWSTIDENNDKWELEITPLAVY